MRRRWSRLAACSASRAPRSPCSCPGHRIAMPGETTRVAHHNPGCGPMRLQMCLSLSDMFGHGKGAALCLGVIAMSGSREARVPGILAGTLMRPSMAVENTQLTVPRVRGHRLQTAWRCPRKHSSGLPCMSHTCRPQAVHVAQPSPLTCDIHCIHALHVQTIRAFTFTAPSAPPDTSTGVSDFSASATSLTSPSWAATSIREEMTLLPPCNMTDRGEAAQVLP